MADDNKRTEMVCFKVTERVLLDLNRLAAAQERSLSEFMYLLLRSQLYGQIVRLQSQAGPATLSDKVYPDGKGES